MVGRDGETIDVPTVNAHAYAGKHWRVGQGNV